MFQKNPAFTPAPRPAAKLPPLEHYLKVQDDLLTQLATLLDRERVALRDRQMPALNEIAEQKSALMLKLQSNDQRIKLHPQLPELKAAGSAKVTALRTKLRNCQRRNEINGKLIRLCLKSTRRVSALLMESRDRYTKNLTYNRKGTKQASGLPRLNIQA